MKKILFLLIISVFVSCNLFNPNDETLPELLIIYPENGDELSVRDTIKVETSDNVGIKKVECEISTNNYSFTEIEVTTPFNFPISFIDNHLDSIQIECISFDENNNQSKPENIMVTINNDLNPINGVHDGDEQFIIDLIEINQLSELYTEETTWDVINNLSRITGIQYRNIVIDSIPLSFENLSQLSLLELINDSLKTLPESIGDLIFLEEIRVQNNQLTKIPESITNLSNLKIIDFSNNEINSIPLEFNNLSCDDCRLEIIKLQNNKINFIDLYEFNHLEVVWLANNELEDINLSCLNSIWSNVYNPENPTVTLYENKLCNNPSSYGSCINEEKLGVQICD